MSNVIGKYIENKRTEKEMNITELANKAGISRPYLSQIESGSRKPSPEILKKLSTPLGVSYMSLMQTAGYIDHLDNIFGEMDEIRKKKHFQTMVYALEEQLNNNSQNNYTEEQLVDLKERLKILNSIQSKKSIISLFIERLQNNEDFPLDIFLLLEIKFTWNEIALSKTEKEYIHSIIDELINFSNEIKEE